MPIASLIPEALGTGTYIAGQPGGAGGPSGPAAPAAGAGWEIKVLAAPDYHTLLARIPTKMLAGSGIQFVKQLDDNQGGSGTVTLNMDDLWWSATTLPNSQPAHYLLDYEHLWQVWQDGVLRYEFLGETVTEQLADPSEQRIATITGPGAIASLAWAMAAPPGFPNDIVYKTDAITDGFSEINGSGQPTLDTGLWNLASPTSHIALNPLGSCRVMGSPSTTFLGTSTYDATTSLISGQVTPIVSPDSAGNTLDGSQLTQFYLQDVTNSSHYILIGLSGSTFYAQYSGPGGTSTHTIATATAFNTANSNNSGYSYWQISENNGIFYIWTSPDGQNWTQQWSVSHSGWSPTQVAFYFTAKYDVDNTEFATITGLNSNVTTSSLAGALYFNEPIMAVWLQQLQAAQTRGTIPFVTTGQLTMGTDSFGNPWTDAQSVQIQNGTDLLTLLQGHASMIDADYIMQPGFRLQVGTPQTGAITLGYDRSSQVIFRDGYDSTSRTRQRVRNQIQNLLGVINSDGRTVTADNTTSASTWGQREAWIQAAVQVTQNDILVVADAAAQQNASEILSYTLTIAPYLAGRTIFTGFDVGDWVGLERPDFSAVDKVRVSAIAVQVSPDASETHELTLVSYVQFLQERLQYIVGKMGGNFISAAGTTAVASNGALTNLNQPTIFAPTLAGLGDVSSGSAGGGAPLVYDPVSGVWIPGGSPSPATGNAAPVQISGPNGVVTIAGGGGGVTVAQPPPTPADVGSPGAVASHQISPTVYTITDATGTVRQVIGQQADGTYTSVDSNGGPPNVPDTPTVNGTLNGIIVAWDGKLAGAAPLSDFLWTEVHMSTSSGFTPSSATLQGTIISAGLFPISGLTVGTTYYVKLVARNTSNTASTASAQASGVPTSLTSSLIGNIGVLNPNPYFAGGDGSTWAGVSGTFAVTSTPPAGSPYAFAGQFTISTSGVGAAAKESGGAFPVVGSGQYYATCWANTPTTSVVLGFDWYTGPNGTGSLISTSTQTFTVTANTWTACTTVQTAPSNAQSAWLRIAPADGVGHVIDFEAILALPQVPGGLIQAGTITATQIAAATITAAQIAASTITSAQIAANTITAANVAVGTLTGANIAAGTIKASNIQAGTITAGLLSAGIIVAGIVDGTTITGATIVADGSSGEVLVYSGTPASGNLIGSWSGASGTDASGNSYPAGLAVQQGGLVLYNQSSAPSGVSGANVFYSASGGRPRFISSSGDNSVLERSQVNVATFPLTGTGAGAVSAFMTYAASEGNQSSEYELEIDGEFITGTSGSTLSFWLTDSGTQLGTKATIGGTMLVASNTWWFTCVARLAILSSTTAIITVAGSIDKSANAGSESSFPVINTTFHTIANATTFDYTLAHQFQIYGQAGSTGCTINTWRTRLTKRM